MTFVSECDYLRGVSRRVRTHIYLLFISSFILSSIYLSNLVVLTPLVDGRRVRNNNSTHPINSINETKMRLLSITLTLLFAATPTILAADLDIETTQIRCSGVCLPRFLSLLVSLEMAYLLASFDSI